MILTTKRLLLRPLGLGDLKTVYEYAGDMENTKYMMFLSDQTEKETEEFLRAVEAQWQRSLPDFYEFAIVLSGLQIGAVSISLDEGRTQGEMGWILNKRYWNKGYATEAASAVIDFAKHVLRLCKIVAHCDWRNRASAKVMEKLGMTLQAENGVRHYKKRDETAREMTYLLLLN